jgi:uncharacterized protein (DUF433 family)
MTVDLYRLRRTPAYPFVEAAHYLNVPVSTLRAWCLGQRYKHKNEIRRFENVIVLDGDPSEGLSFLNLVEAHVLTAFRRRHRIPLPKIRQALEYTSRKLEIDRPLADERLQTDGLDLLVTTLGTLINVSREGQLEMASVIEAYLSRIKRDADGVPIQLFPFTRNDDSSDAPAPVEINPLIAFGRPILVGRSVPTAVLADRFKAGDSLADLSEDYDTTSEAIEEAIRCELDRRAA